MKKMFKCLLSLVALLMTLPAAAQQSQQLPLDPAVRTGVLPNGLTYYIRHNEYPKGQADFYIAQKVGSILEDDNQRGLAHFLEHMCFNGTDNFPGNSLISYLESIGVKFGYNLNAYTGVDETVYNISNVPVARESVQDTVLMILHDWADGLTLDPKEIDKERGVIHNEWRTTNKGQMRILTEVFPKIYPDSKYAYRLPIGTMEVVDNFPPQALRDYYEKWYRPDQQGVIVVGDIDVDRIESKIKEIFSPIQMPANPAPREYFPVPDHKGTIYGIGKDPEQTSAIVQLMFLSDPLTREQRGSIDFLATNYIESMISSMLNARMQEIALKPDSPFAAAGVTFGDYIVAKTKDAFVVYGLAKENPDLIPVLKAIYREVLRAAKNGFTQTEFDRARSEYLTHIESAYKNRTTAQNDSYVNEYVRNFIDGDAAPGIETEYQIVQMIAPAVPVEAINQAMAALVTDDNRVVLAMLPGSATLPTEEAFAAAVAEVDAESMEAYVDNVKAEPLIASLPAPGKVVETKEIPAFGATEWTLSNGTHVIYKKTDFKDDEILFTAVANGGSSDYEAADADLIALTLGNQLLSGGNYSNSDLEKYLKGKKVSLTLSIDDYTRDFTGATTPKDLPSLMEVFYAMFTTPYIDAQEFDAIRNMYGGILAQKESDPEFVFGQKVNEAMYPNASYKRQLSKSYLDQTTLEGQLGIIKTALANAADYTYIFVGNVDPEQLKGLCEQYIATLPADAAKASKGTPRYNDKNTLKGGRGTETFTAPMATPQTYTFICETANLPYNLRNWALTSMAGQVLTNRLLETVREEEGAVYSISAHGHMARLSPRNIVIQSIFPMDPSKKDFVLKQVDKEFNDMAKEIKPEELKKVQEFMVKSFKEGLAENSAWIGYMGGFQRNGVNNMADYEQTILSITPADLADFMKQINGQGNYRVVLLDPAK